MDEDDQLAVGGGEDVSKVSEKEKGKESQAKDTELSNRQPAEDDESDEDVELQTPFLNKGSSKPTLTESQRLITSKNAKNLSLMALRLGVLADSVNTTILRPSYPFLVIPPDQGGLPDAFPTTEPFDFGAAQYFLPLTALLGTAIAATFVGSLSDRVGRRPVMLVCLGFGVVGSICKYFARGSFWAFCGCNFMTGLFGYVVAGGPL